MISSEQPKLTNICCPKCGNSMFWSVTIPENNYAYFYCQNRDCRVRKVCIDIRDKEVLNIEYFKTKEAKEKILNEALLRNYRHYSYKTKIKLKSLYEKIRNNGGDGDGS